MAAEACRSVTTVTEVLRGRGGAQSRAAVAQAAKRLGIELPTPRAAKPDASPAHSGAADGPGAETK